MHLQSPAAVPVQVSARLALDMLHHNVDIIAPNPQLLSRFDIKHLNNIWITQGDQIMPQTTDECGRHLWMNLHDFDGHIPPLLSVEGFPNVTLGIPTKGLLQLVWTQGAVAVTH
jgi:hypothetical protein